MSTPVNLSRRTLLTGAGGALLLQSSAHRADAAPAKTVIFAHTTVVNVEAVQNDVAHLPFSVAASAARR